MAAIKTLISEAIQMPLAFSPLPLWQAAALAALVAMQAWDGLFVFFFLTCDISSSLEHWHVKQESFAISHGPHESWVLKSVSQLLYSSYKTSPGGAEKWRLFPLCN